MFRRRHGDSLALIARQLLETFGWSVCFAVGDFNQDDPVEHEGIRFFRYQIFQRNIIEYARQRFSKRKWFPIINSIAMTGHYSGNCPWP